MGTYINPHARNAISLFYPRTRSTVARTRAEAQKSRLAKSGPYPPICETDLTPINPITAT